MTGPQRSGFHTAAFAGHDANLDLLRSVAVLLVLFAHVLLVLGCIDQPTLANWSLAELGPVTAGIPGLKANPNLTAWGIADLGRAGVLLFFIHTSLVLMMSLARMERSKGRIGVRSFYIRRAFRIYPLALFALLTTLIFRIPPHFEKVYIDPSPAAIAANATLTQNIFQAPEIVGPMWSLPFEVQMYLLLPLLYLAARRVRTWPGALGILAAGFVLWYIEHRLSMALHYRGLLEFAPFFFMGITAFALFRIAPGRWSGRWFALSLFALIVLRCLAVRFVQDYRFSWAQWALFAAFALLLPSFKGISGARLGRCTHLIAKYSYGIYLAHVPILWLSFQLLSGRPVWFQIALCAALLATVPVALYHWLEEPLIRAGVRLAA